MEYCTRRVKDLQLHGIAWMNYADMMLSKRSQIQMIINYMTHLHKVQKQEEQIHY